MMKQAGFGLLEILVSLLILSVVILGFLQVQGRNSIASINASKQAMTVQILQNQAGVLKVMSDEQKQHYRTMLDHLYQSVQSQANPFANYQQTTQTITASCTRLCDSKTFAQNEAINTAKAIANLPAIATSRRCGQGFCWVVAWSDQTMVDIEQLCPNGVSQDCLVMEMP